MPGSPLTNTACGAPDRLKLVRRLGAPGEGAEVEHGIGLVFGGGEAVHRADIAIAPAALRFDEARVRTLVAERVPDRQDMAFQDFGLDVHVAPQGRQQFVMRHQSPGMLDQIAEHVERLRRQVEALFPAVGARPP